MAINPLLKPSQKGERRNGAARSIAKGSRYEVLKEKIRGWWDDRLRIGEALREIQEGKLYQSEYQTFEDFCEEEYGLKRAQAYALISASNVKTSIQMSAVADKIVNIKQTRALASVPKEQRVAVIEQVVERGPVTAKAITEVARETKQKAEAGKVHFDKIGYRIPETIESDWNDAESFHEILGQLHRIKLRIQKAVEESDLTFREITNSTVADLENVWRDLQRVLPYAVCPTCQGRNRSKCTLCKQRGFISKFGYEHWVPKKTREIREKAIKK